MDEASGSNEQSKWPRRLAFVFLLLFALFWSLGPFFFWVFLGLAAYFAFLSFANSASIKESIAGLFSSITREKQPMNPYQAFRPRPNPPEATTMPHRAIKIVRVLMIVSASLLVFLFLVGIFTAKEEPTHTAETVEGAEATPDDGTSYWNDRGNASLENAKYDSAFYFYDQALAIDPKNTYALYNKGLAYTLQQDYRRANAYARKCTRFHPDYDPAWWLLGYNYDVMNNTDSALYCLEKAYQNDYSQPEFLQLTAEVYIKKDRRKDALAVYQKLVTLDTTKVDIFRKMAELDPANADAYRRKAAALEK